MEKAVVSPKKYVKYIISGKSNKKGF